MKIEYSYKYIIGGISNITKIDKLLSKDELLNYLYNTITHIQLPSQKSNLLIFWGNYEVCTVIATQEIKKMFPDPPSQIKRTEQEWINDEKIAKEIFMTFVDTFK